MNPRIKETDSALLPRKAHGFQVPIDPAGQHLDPVFHALETVWNDDVERVMGTRSTSRSSLQHED